MNTSKLFQLFLSSMLAITTLAARPAGDYRNFNEFGLLGGKLALCLWTHGGPNDAAAGKSVTAGCVCISHWVSLTAMSAPRAAHPVQWRFATRWTPARGAATLVQPIVKQVAGLLLGSSPGPSSIALCIPMREPSTLNPKP